MSNLRFIISSLIFLIISSLSNDPCSYFLYRPEKKFSDDQFCDISEISEVVLGLIFVIGMILSEFSTIEVIDIGWELLEVGLSVFSSLLLEVDGSV